MTNKKFFIRIVLAITLACLPVSVQAFSDIDKNSNVGKAVSEMQQRGYIQGFGDGTFRPDATLTRAEFVTIINKMYGYSVKAENIFTDVRESDWFYGDVLAGFQAGYIKGMGDGRFAPNEAVTREQVCVMLNSILNVGDTYFMPEITDKVSDWARESVEKLVANYLFVLENGGKFRATQPITRGEVCVALEKCIVDVDFDDIERINLDELAEEELERRIKSAIDGMETKVIPAFTFPETIKVGNMLVESMGKYLKDHTHDYISDAKETYEVYRHLGKVRVTEFKNTILKNMSIEDLTILFDFFYTPEIDAVD